MIGRQMSQECVNHINTHKQKQRFNPIPGQHAVAVTKVSKVYVFLFYIVCRIKNQLFMSLQVCTDIHYQLCNLHDLL